MDVLRRAKAEHAEKGSTVWGLGFRVWRLGFRVWDSGCGVGFGIWGLRFRVSGLGPRGLGIKIFGFHGFPHYPSIYKPTRRGVTTEPIRVTARRAVFLGSSCLTTFGRSLEVSANVIFLLRGFRI